MYGKDWSQYLYELQQQIQHQDARIRSLEEQIQRLVNDQQQKNGTVIEKVEYKFDQLKIETLSGSLQIGLSPEELKNMEDLALGQASQLSPTNNLPSFEQQLTSQLQNWLQGSGPSMISDLAKNYNRTIDDSHQSLMLHDIQKQFPNRIKYYKEQAMKNNTALNEQELADFIFNKIKDEVRHSLTNYMKDYKGE
ncbi:spore germination protein GerPC [Oceanobacillus salinisoli]|uniref:spore germination protein GerPC n=1 Tax=Oceanobacillus salinisoli TaxID=2678611 RepID=UPI0012E126B9|nr:spore germination protein GerPC [Oceanobacillus salinisoli]